MQQMTIFLMVTASDTSNFSITYIVLNFGSSFFVSNARFTQYSYVLHQLFAPGT